jgi:RNA polymerase sigma-70 factor (ECF subfamily)
LSSVSAWPATMDLAPTADPADEADVVARAKRDPAEFAPLYRRYVGPVYRYCYHRLGAREAAEDATSAVFAKALAALPRCRDDAFRSWLFAIAHNVVVDRFRGTRADEPLEAAVGLAAGGPTPEELAVSADDRRALSVFLGRLPADQRQVVELRLAGLSGVEVARALGRSHAAVRMLQSRAVAHLRAWFGEAGAAPGDADGRG